MHFWVAALLMLAGTSAWADDPDQLTFCTFGPKLRVLEPETNDSKDKCTGSAKVQAILWECVPGMEVNGKVSDFLFKLNRAASAECSKHCSKRASGCQGKFVASKNCGLGTTREEAMIMGKRQGCRKECSGDHFAYCSIYDAGYRTVDGDRIATQKPNCFCSR